MRRFFLAIAVAGLSLAASAAPIPLILLETESTAVAEGKADVQTGSGTETLAPIITSAMVVGAVDFASSSGIAGPGVLSTTAEAFSGSSFASAVGTASYVATFTGATAVGVHLDLGLTTSTSAGSDAFGSLLVHVAAGNATLYEQLVGTAGQSDLLIPLPATAGVQSVRLLLWSEASTVAGGAASNAAVLSFAVSPVPEAGTLVLMAGGLVFVGMRLRRAAR